MRRYMPILAVAIAALSMPAQAQEAPARFVLCEDDCMIVDATGALVTKRRFETLDPFAGATAIFKRKEKFGAIDTRGRTILKARFTGIAAYADRFLVGFRKTRHSSDTADVYDVTGRRLFQAKGADLSFGTWAGHLYYYEQCPDGDRTRPCRFVFLDDHGAVAARFGYFFVRDDRFAEAQDESGKGGFIDASLRYVVPPIYRYTQPFEGDLAKVQGASGGSLAIGRAGQVVIPAGRYKIFFLSDNTPLVTAFAEGKPNCPILVRPDGRELALPPGVCGDSDDSLLRFGYARVQGDANRLKGTIDAAGRIGVPPVYPSLQPLNRRYLVFADAPDRAKNSGIVGIDGRVVLPLQPARIQAYASSPYHQPGELRDMLIARTDAGAGVMNFKGKWLVAPRYRDIKIISPDLLALEATDYSVEFADGAGRILPLTSAYVGIPSPVTGAFAISRCDRAPGSGNCRYGLADQTGQVMLAPRFDAIEEKAGGLWHVRRQDGYRTLWGVVDSHGVEVIPPDFTELDSRAGLQPVVAADRDFHQVLIDAHGAVLARYQPRKRHPNTD